MGVFVEIIAPILGAVIKNVMFFSPLPAVIRVRQSERLGQLNPLPYPVIACNAISWLIYATVIRDPYIFAANMFGVMLSIVYTISTVAYASKKIRDYMMIMTVIFPSIFLVQVFTYAMIQADEKVVQFGTGLTNNIMVFFHYASPLTVFYKVIVTRDCSSLHLPLVLMNLANASMWFTYGLIALKDPFIWVCNAVGIALCMVAIVLMVIYPRKEKTDNYFVILISQRLSSKKLPSTTEMTKSENRTVAENSEEPSKATVKVTKTDQVTTVENV
eukprot:TRINITY_DN2741_c0_g2_i1.p1 TRINITY_DN2741_c0_g2~~TRINITY_DN2741_c0_g2_i1.p1  ORF type:complete len:273 (-),score=-2.63 TRINITY_DN2741_c0_g2_i1:2345-3163(-)